MVRVPAAAGDGLCDCRGAGDGGPSAAGPELALRAHRHAADAVRRAYDAHGTQRSHGTAHALVLHLGTVRRPRRRDQVSRRPDDPDAAAGDDGRDAGPWARGRAQRRVRRRRGGVLRSSAVFTARSARVPPRRARRAPRGRPGARRPRVRALHARPVVRLGAPLPRAAPRVRVHARARAEPARVAPARGARRARRASAGPRAGLRRRLDRDRQLRQDRAGDVQRNGPDQHSVGVRERRPDAVRPWQQRPDQRLRRRRPP